MEGKRLKKEFGKAKLFEIRRVVRRIKQLSLKKGTSQQLAKNKRKIERLETQLEFLKETQFEEFTEAVDMEADNADASKEKWDQNDVKSLLMSKLLAIVRKSDINDKGRLKTFEKGSEFSGVHEKDDDIESNADLQSMEIIGSERTTGIHVEQYNGKKEILECTKQQSQDFLNKSTEKDFNKRDQEDKKKVRKWKGKKMNVPDNDNESSSDSEIGCKPSLSFDSVFVGSLSNGRGKIKEKHKKEGKRRQNGKKNILKEVKKKGNRLGQRQRRQQWEKLYGKKANHLKKEKFKDHVNIAKSKIDRGPKNGTLKTKSKNTAGLHPSWEASKSKRKSESIVAFEGMKITFDD